MLRLKTTTKSSTKSLAKMKNKPSSLSEDDTKMFAECSLINDKAIEAKTRKRYAEQFRQLEFEGFQFEGLMQIEHLLGYLPFALLAGIGGREVMKWHGTSLSWFHPLFRSADGETIAFPLGIATRFYTFFEDNYAQRTSNGAGTSKYVENCGLHTETVQSDIAGTWLHHLAYCEQLADEGKQPIANANVDVLLKMQISEDTMADKLTALAMGWGPLIFVGWTVAAWALKS